MTLLQSVHVTAAIIRRQRVIKIHIYVKRVPAGLIGYRVLWRMIKGEAFIFIKYYHLPLNDYSDAVCTVRLGASGSQGVSRLHRYT